MKINSEKAILLLDIVLVVSIIASLIFEPNETKIAKALSLGLLLLIISHYISIKPND